MRELRSHDRSHRSRLCYSCAEVSYPAARRRLGLAQRAKNTNVSQLFSYLLLLLILFTLSYLLWMYLLSLPTLRVAYLCRCIACRHACRLSLHSWLFADHYFVTYAPVRTCAPRRFSHTGSPHNCTSPCPYTSFGRLVAARHAPSRVLHAFTPLASHHSATQLRS